MNFSTKQMTGPLRRQPRMHLALDVKIQGPGVDCTATSVEVSGGGMSLQKVDHLSIALPVVLAFTLPSAEPVRLNGVVWWKRDRLVGVRFDPADRHSLTVRRFVEGQAAAAATKAH
jgi:hypothetical protein